ncbi:MAG: hypothetical protein WBO44_13200 [Saprospiraceae bacterium]
MNHFIDKTGFQRQSYDGNANNGMPNCIIIEVSNQVKKPNNKIESRDCT